MKLPEIPDYSNAPCKSLIVENIRNVENGKELTAPLAHLNRSCEFRRIWNKLGEKEIRKAYRQSDKYKAYQQSDKRKAYLKAYYQSNKYKASQKAYLKAYYQRKKLENKK